MKLEPQFEQFLIRDLWQQVRENFKRDGYLTHIGIFLTDQHELEIALLDKLPKMMLGNFLQMSAERLQASVVITISEGWITPREILDKSGQPSTETNSKLRESSIQQTNHGTDRSTQQDSLNFRSTSTTQTNCDTNESTHKGSLHIRRLPCPYESNFFGSQPSKRVHVVIIKVQSALGEMKSFTPITRPELPESFEPFSYTSEPKGDFAICFPRQKLDLLTDNLHTIQEKSNNHARTI